MGRALLLGAGLAALTQMLARPSRAQLAKASPFECGFLPSQTRRRPFSLQFFLVALVFLIFDIEIVVLFPLLLSGLHAVSLSVVPALAFLGALVGGLALE